MIESGHGYTYGGNHSRLAFAIVKAKHATSTAEVYRLKTVQVFLNLTRQEAEIVGYSHNETQSHHLAWNFSQKVIWLRSLFIHGRRHLDASTKVFLFFSFCLILLFFLLNYFFFFNIKGTCC